MKVPTFQCPHCGNNLGTAVNAYLYGSPFRICNRCKKSYVDKRYHEIAIEGIRREDIDPTQADKQAHRKSGSTAIWIGVGMLALFILVLFTGWIVFPLPIFGVISIINGIRAMHGDSRKALEKTRKALELERQQSMLRMQNPQYVERLRSIGYPVLAPAGTASPNASGGGNGKTAPGAAFCSRCGAAIEEKDKFCSNCGSPR